LKFIVKEIPRNFFLDLSQDFRKSGRISIRFPASFAGWHDKCIYTPAPKAQALARTCTRGTLKAFCKSNLMQNAFIFSPPFIPHPRLD